MGCRDRRADSRTTIIIAGDLEEDARQLEQDLEKEQTTIVVLRGPQNLSFITLKPLLYGNESNFHSMDSSSQKSLLSNIVILQPFLTHTDKQRQRAVESSAIVRYAHTHTRAHTHAHTYVHTHIHTHTHTHTRTHAHTCTHTHTHTHTHTGSNSRRS
jgi:hypothetical protein